MLGLLGRITCCVFLTFAAACGSDDNGGDGDGDGDGDIDISSLSWNACSPDTRVGGFTVELAESFTGTGGRVTDGVSPIGLLETLSTSGECRHQTAVTTFCDPACTGGDQCGTDGVCRAAPSSQSVGTVSVHGLMIDVAMEPLPPGNAYTNPGTLPHPAFDAGVGIALRAAGGAYAPFELLGAGVSSFELDATSVPLSAGSALPLTWTPPSAAGPFRLEIELNVNLHGTGGSRITCDVEDNGSFSIPEVLVTALVNDGLSGFPSITFIRSSADSEVIEPGCVDFRVVSSTTLEVEIPGLESCSGDEDCMVAGETCQPDLTCG